MKQDIMGLAFDNVTMDEAIAYVKKKVEKNEKCCVVTPNAEIAYQAKSDNKLRKIINKQSTLVIPDGAGVILAGKIIGKPLKEKVAGVEFAEILVKSGFAPIFFLGGKPGVAQQAAANLRKKHPNANICGCADGYFKSPEDAIEKANASGAKIIFLCLGAPKQEYFMSDYGGKFNANVVAGLGGSLDVFAGVVKRAPKLFVKLHLEWFYRLLKQPSRIKRMAALPLYVLDSIKYRIRGGRNA